MKLPKLSYEKNWGKPIFGELTFLKYCYMYIVVTFWFFAFIFSTFSKQSFNFYRRILVGVEFIIGLSTFTLISFLL